MTIRLACGYSFLNSEHEIRKNFLPIAHNFDYCACIDGRYAGYTKLQPLKNKITRLIKRLDIAPRTEKDIIEIELNRLRERLRIVQEEYNKNPDPLYSTDKGPNLLKSLDNCEVIQYAGYQPDKRQKYLDACKGKDIDYLMVLDTDEYPHPDFCNWDYFKKDLERIGKENPDRHVFYMWYYVKKEWIKAKNSFRNDRWIVPIRIIKNPENVRYAFGCHYYFMLKGQPENGSIGNLKARGYRLTPIEKQGIFAINKYIPDGVRLTADSALRSKESLKIRQAWATWGLWEERKILMAKSNEIMNSPGAIEIMMAAMNREKLQKKNERMKMKIKPILSNR